MQGLEAIEDGGAGQHLDEVAEQVQSRAGVGVVPDRTAGARVSLGLEKEEGERRCHVGSWGLR